MERDTGKGRRPEIAPLSRQIPTAPAFSFRSIRSPFLSLSFSLSARCSSSSVPLRFPRPATTFAPGRIDTRRGGCNDRRPIRSAAIKLYHRLEWRLYFGNLATRHSHKTLPQIVQKHFFDYRCVYQLYFVYFQKTEWTRER